MSNHNANLLADIYTLNTLTRTLSIRSTSHFALVPAASIYQLQLVDSEWTIETVDFVSSARCVVAAFRLGMTIRFQPFRYNAWSFGNPCDFTLLGFSYRIMLWYKHYAHIKGSICLTHKTTFYQRGGTWDRLLRSEYADCLLDTVFFIYLLLFFHTLAIQKLFHGNA